MLTIQRESACDGPCWSWRACENSCFLVVAKQSQHQLHPPHRAFLNALGRRTPGQVAGQVRPHDPGALPHLWRCRDGGRPCGGLPLALVLPGGATGLARSAGAGNQRSAAPSCLGALAIFSMGGLPSCRRPPGNGAHRALRAAVAPRPIGGLCASGAPPSFTPAASPKSPFRSTGTAQSNPVLG